MTPLKTAVLQVVCLSAAALAIEYPDTIKPGKAAAVSQGLDKSIIVENQVLGLELKLTENRLGFGRFEDKQAKHSIEADSQSELFVITLSDDQTLACSKMKINNVSVSRFSGAAKGLAHRRGADPDSGCKVTVDLQSADDAVKVNATVLLRDESNYIRLFVRVEPGNRDITVKSIRFLSLPVQQAQVCGIVGGSPVVAKTIFVAYEQPLSFNEIDEQTAPPARLNCYLNRNTVLRAGQSLEQSAVMGVVPQGQLRRGFLYYLERERAQRYRQYLHYNSWYHLNIGMERKDRMTEADCLKAIEHIGRELVEKRGVVLDGFVWDDGWDDFDSLWDFHEGFPNGFSKMAEAAQKYNSRNGVWLSPIGGYGEPQKLRLEYGKQHGYEINESGYSLAGPVYYKAFRDRCIQMMQNYGVNSFKFDGIGGIDPAGILRAEGNLANDVDAMLRLINDLREEDPSVYISATTGTWASPYFLFYADNVWRQGLDTGFHGTGPMREQWITYRDMIVYHHVVKSGPLYPLNALMPHGLVIDSRFDPGKMELDSKLIANEVWMMFGCGTNLLELYITPELLSQQDWDVIAQAAKWARNHTDVLVDTHWVGGDPGQSQIYGYASWVPQKGVLVLRNPNEKENSITMDMAEVFELSASADKRYVLTSPQQSNQTVRITVEAGKPHTFTMKPYEVLVLDAMPTK